MTQAISGFPRSGRMFLCGMDLEPDRAPTTPRIFTGGVCILIYNKTYFAGKRQQKQGRVRFTLIDVSALDTYPKPLSGIEGIVWAIPLVGALDWVTWICRQFF